MKVFAGHDGGSGCAYYRMFLPLRELDKHDGYEVTFAASGDYGAKLPTVTARHLEGHDVIVGQRWNSHEGLEIWRRARTPYNRLVYDLDDDVFNVGPENWAAYSLYNRADIQDATIHSAETADLVTVSTEPLAEVMREYSGNVAVLPNHIPSWVLDLPRQQRDRPVTGWAGGASHGLDIAIVAEPVRRFLSPKRFPGWTVLFGGTDYRPTFAAEGVPAEQMAFAPWIYITRDARGYYASIDYDIGLCPLNPTPFSRSKSALKALEMNARGIPVLASDCEAYRPYIRDGINGFLIKYEHEWLSRLSELASDDALRAKMSESSRECARQYVIEDGYQMWATAYQGLFSR